jgi:hypothetical protein
MIDGILTTSRRLSAETWARIKQEYREKMHDKWRLGEFGPWLSVNKLTFTPLKEITYMHPYLHLLGHEVRDRVTGYKGIVTSVHFDLYGCVQAFVNLPFDEKSRERDAEVGRYFDAKRLVQQSSEPVMEQPTFGMFVTPLTSEFDTSVIPGPADKPLPPSA